MSLYYLISSLPLLRLDAEPGIKPDAFIRMCREQLGAAEADAVEALFTGEAYAHPFVAAWRDKETILRNAIAKHRARLAGSDASRWLRPTSGCDAQLESFVEDAFQERDPLQREKDLDEARWAAAEGLQGVDPLSVNVIFGYAIKLAILSRWSGLGAEAGRQAFDTLTQPAITLERAGG
jgi:hypothetical protein